MRVGLVGCGNIAERYARTILAEPLLELAGATDVVPGRAAALVASFGGIEYPTLEALLADEAVDTVVNLTTPRAHAEITAKSLEARKHVHTEKPVALRYEEAAQLAELAQRLGIRLSCAPATLLGEAQQTAWKLLRDGSLGRIRAVYAEANWGRIERWHPAPQSLYEAGPMVDVGIYPLTILTAIFGPARRVRAYGAMIERDRVTCDGTPFRLSAPDFVVALLELEDEVIARLTASFWIGPSRQRGLEFHGERASLHLATWAEFDSGLELTENGEDYRHVPLLRTPYQGIHWSRPLTDLAEAIEEGRPHRAGAEHAAHVVEILCAIESALQAGGPIEITSEFDRPLPVEWAR